jgi:hypothetical protein
LLFKIQVLLFNPFHDNGLQGSTQIFWHPLPCAAQKLLNMLYTGDLADQIIMSGRLCFLKVVVKSERIRELIPGAHGGALGASGG